MGAAQEAFDPACNMYDSIVLQAELEDWASGS